MCIYYYVGNIMNIMHNYFCRHETNCDDEEDTTVSVSAGDDGVEAVEDISMESVTSPPDNLVAEEIQHNEEFAQFQKKQNTGKPQPSTSTSTTSISSKVHLQDISKNSRLTPAAKQRMAMQSAMLSMFEKSQSKMSEETEDDLDLSFASIAMRMRRNFDLLQREQIHVEIMNIVNEAIRNKKKAQGTPNCSKDKHCRAHGENAAITNTAATAKPTATDSSCTTSTTNAACFRSIAPSRNSNATGPIDCL